MNIFLGLQRVHVERTILLFEDSEELPVTAMRGQVGAINAFHPRLGAFLFLAYRRCVTAVP
jgi:hypothetical protein